MRKCLQHSVWLFFLVLMSATAAAQTNPYKIDDELYKIYERAFKERTNRQGMVIADTLYRQAVAKDDKKAACLALTIPMHCYMNNNDSAAFFQAVHRLQEVSRANGYLQYYYHGYNNLIIWLLNNGHSLAALQMAEKMKQEARKDRNDYGLFSCLRMQGHIYTMRENRAMGVRFYKMALNFQLEYLPEQDPAPLYCNIADYYRHLDEDSLQLALNYVEKGIELAKTYEIQMLATLRKSQIFFEMGRSQEFVALFDSCQKAMDKRGVVQKRLCTRLEVYKDIVQGDTEQALSHIDKIRNPYERYSLLRTVAIRNGDYKQAYQYTSRLMHFKDSVAAQIQSSDLAELTVQLGNERMKREAKSLELENTALTLKNTQLELERAKAQAYIEQSNAENSKLILQNRDLELEKLNGEVERQKALQTLSKNRIILLSVALAFLSLLFCLLGYNSYRHRKLVNELTQSNQALAVARDLAEQSDNMKTQFIQNMSHEIRTPLNAIVGFSQLLTAPGMTFSDKEKAEYGELILHNSELLTTLINDVLDLASLESGKYTMHLAPCRCNDLCRTALASVRHRKGDTVKQAFTSEVDDDFLLTTDEKRVEQVLINFLTNAEKYTEEGEILLHCSTSETPGCVTFSVADTGPGVPPDKADLIFQHFYKLNHFKQGTGLGLNICCVIAERLHGKVEYDRTYTRGARFVFTLPLKHNA